MTNRSQVISSLRWMAAAKVVGQLLNWLITIVVIRLLSPDDYGLIAMATTFIALLQMVSELGLGTALVQAKEIDDRRLSQVFGATLVLNVAIYAALFASAPLIAAYFNDARLTAIIWVSGLGFLITIPLVVPDAQLRRSMAFKGIALVEVGCSVAGNLVTLALAYAGQAAWSLVFGTLAFTALRVASTIAIAPKWVWPRFTLRNSRGLLTFGGTITLSRILWYFMSQADVLVAGRLLGRETLGFYSLAITVASMPMERVMAIVNPVAFPALARMQHDVVGVSRAMTLSVTLVGLAAFPVFWGISSIAYELVEVLLGARWLDAAIALQIVSLVMPFRMISSLLSVATSAMGRPDIELKVTLIGAIVMPLAFVVGSERGLEGLCFAWLFGVPVVYGVSLASRLVVLGMTAGQMARAVVPSLVCALLMYCAVEMVRWVGAGRLVPVAQLAALIVTGTIVYAVSSWLFNRPACIAAWSTLKARS